MDFISEIVQGNAPVEVPINLHGTDGKVFVRRLTGQQKLALVKGKKYNFDSDTKKVASIEIDLEGNELEQQKLVQFCICEEKGKDRFKTLAEVQALPADLIAALYMVARDHNKSAVAPEEEPGEA